MQLAIDIVLFLAGFALLTFGADFLVRGASRVAVRLSVSSVVIGLTIVAFGTSLPELMVVVIANLETRGANDIAIGNIIGSNIANIGLILGIAALMASVRVETDLVRREIPLLIGLSVLFIILSWNGQLGRVEGAILAIGLVAFTYYSYTNVRSATPESTKRLEAVQSLDPAIAKANGTPWRDAGLIILGLVMLVFGADWLVSAAESLARAFGISELVIGLTLVAVGTSLPELATTLAAVRQNDANIAVGNAIGSNLFNMLFIGGTGALIRPLTVPDTMFRVDFPVMMGFTILVFVLALPKPHQLRRWHGAVLLGAYALYTAWLFLGPR
jgi:cation:H+ antiporter